MKKRFVIGYVIEEHTTKEYIVLEIAKKGLKIVRARCNDKTMAEEIQQALELSEGRKFQTRHQRPRGMIKPRRG